MKTENRYKPIAVLFMRPTHDQDPGKNEQDANPHGWGDSFAKAEHGDQHAPEQTDRAVGICDMQWDVLQHLLPSDREKNQDENRARIISQIPHGQEWLCRRLF